MRKLSQPQSVNNMERTYQNAIALLNTRRRASSQRWKDEQSESTKKQAHSSNMLGVKGKPALHGMGNWVEQLGYSYKNVSLDIVHVAGTKGKGSTCAFASSFLQQRGRTSGFPEKIGLYTSPPLITTRERIQINATPISEQLFTRYTFEVWERLWYHASQTTDGLENMPRYRQFLMLLSLHVFVKEEVDIAVYETHSGGEYDCTNIIRPAVTGITTIGMDHVRALGPKIEDIAWHKAGIFKPGVPAFSMEQSPEVAAVLKNRATEKGTQLHFVDLDDRLPREARALKFKVQKKNASLAISLAETVLKKKLLESDCRLSKTDIVKGVDHFSWPGRFHTVQDGNHQWYLDTAHNELSLKVATEWFAQSLATAQKRYALYDCLILEQKGFNAVRNVDTAAHPTRVLIFAHNSDRDKTALLRSVVDTLKLSNIQVQHHWQANHTWPHFLRFQLTVVDFYNTTQAKISLDDLQELGQIWRQLDSTTHISLESTIEEALLLAVTLANPDYGLQAFITGHDRLIGPALSILEPSHQDLYLGERSGDHD
ncbi:Folylpolyglutamate synthase [Lachnellula hyalina]|uniref:tetrahydrofolate synthase n=1 Tax=Lachnellula hyalina TaxID=1316788 RepID=A0A8H8R1B4_9HELO|nr:Folylpolyglutamate synthase [Lachnellula hyalina]TVY25851.1 Folylpolyglutamate synthase [Lachnellula hyalina]